MIRGTFKGVEWVQCVSRGFQEYFKEIPKGVSREFLRYWECFDFESIMRKFPSSLKGDSRFFNFSEVLQVPTTY